MLMQILKAKTPRTTISSKKNYCATDTWIKSHCREGMEYERPMGVFVDFQKAFDCNDQSVIIAVLESYDLDSRLSD